MGILVDYSMIFGQLEEHDLTQWIRYYIKLLEESV